MTLATQLVNREKTRTELVNSGFNRYSLNSKDDLPPWFLDDEEKHYKSNIPITKEAVDALRAKMRALDARPIKKVAEAKARKKFKAAQRLEKTLKKAEGVNETTDLTEREKAKQIEKLLAKGAKTKLKKDIKVVVAKGANRGQKGRPQGVKGRYVMVDSRMKKEVRDLLLFVDTTCSRDSTAASEETEREGQQEAQTHIGFRLLSLCLVLSQTIISVGRTSHPVSLPSSMIDYMAALLVYTSVLYSMSWSSISRLSHCCVSCSAEYTFGGGSRRSDSLSQSRRNCVHASSDDASGQVT